MQHLHYKTTFVHLPGYYGDGAHAPAVLTVCNQWGAGPDLRVDTSLSHGPSRRYRPQRLSVV